MTEKQQLQPDVTPTTDGERAMVALRAALHAYTVDDSLGFERQLDQLTVGPRVATHAAIVDVARSILGKIWQRGWQPADVVRAVRRQFGDGHVPIVAAMLTEEALDYSPATLDDRWSAQLRALGAAMSPGELANQLGGDRSEMLRREVEVIVAINGLPTLPILIPPPGQGLAGGHPGDFDERVLGKIRALLAKAESSGFPNEADAFTAKAQELMARHSIDHALLASTGGRADEPFGVRIGIDTPYAPAKALLLHHVAEANMCQAVWSPDDGFATVFGFAADLDAVELLFTSLLVQATSAMVRETVRGDRAGASRKRAFRQSFLDAYAARLGKRLTDVLATTRTAAGDARLLPVLASRDETVRETVGRIFPALKSRAMRVKDVDGWVSGTAAADAAPLPGERAPS